MKRTLLIGAVALLAASVSAEAQRDQIRIVGSSTVYPFATKVAEQFGRTSNHKTPVVESTGSGGGMKLFCSRRRRRASGHHQRLARIKSSEFETVHDERRHRDHRGQDRLRRHRAGQLAQGRPADPDPSQIFLALAKDVPIDGKLVPNPY